MEPGSQRLPLHVLNNWEKLKFGIFFHFGTSTFDGIELSPGELNLSSFTADADLQQWVDCAKQAGAKYAIFTAKHVGGLCMWPSEYTSYNIMNTPVRRDLVGEFCQCCRDAGILPCLYYSSWDNHHLFGSKTPSAAVWDDAFVTHAYYNFQKNQLLELLQRYSPLLELWIDIPHVLGRSHRTDLYETLTAQYPDTIVLFNHGLSMMDGRTINIAKTWPTDILTIEQNLPLRRIVK